MSVDKRGGYVIGEVDMSVSGDPYAQPLDEDSGPQTVRILPEDEDVETKLMDPDDPDLRPLQRGTLYTPALQAQSYGSGQAYVPYDPSAPQQQLQAPASSQPRQIAIEPIEPEGGRLAKRGGGDAPPASGGPVIIKKGPSTCAIVTGIVALLLFSCALLGYAGLNEGFSRLFGWIPNPFQAPKTVIDTSRPTVIESIRQQFKIVSVEYHMEKIVIGTSTGVLPDWLVRDRLVLIAVGEVQAGVDLGKLKDGDIRVVSDTVRIKLPPAEILGQHLDEEQTQVFERDMTLITRADPNLESQVRQEAVVQMVAGAKENGILEKARVNAEHDLRLFLTALGYKNVIFEPSESP